MAVDEKVPLAVRSNLGVELWSSTGLKSPYQQDSRFPKEETKNCRSMVFSPDGAHFAYTNGNAVKIIDTSTWKEKWVLSRPKAFHLKFSPRGKYICTWEQFNSLTATVEMPKGAPNLYVYCCETGECVFSTIQKKNSDWEPAWSADETLFALMIGGEAFFYELDKGIEGFEKSSKIIGTGKQGILSIAPGHSPPNILFYTPGAKGAPSMCKIYKYPALQPQQNIACKSFFQADRVEIMWNKKGTGVLLLTSTEVDQSGASYYGKQALHYMAIKGESCSVPLSKDGPLHAVQWSPKSNEFVVVYGYMPAKAALFNSKCDIVFDFGDGSRNSAYFNPFGNLLLLAGFGNLRGYIEVWDVIKKIKVAEMTAPDSTHLEWCPSGEFFVTATTAPRLRIGNGFKVWHYSGALLHETLWPQGQELLGVEWKKVGDGIFKEPVISNVKIEGIKSSQPEASKQVYQPPNIRLMLEGKSSDSIPQPSIQGSSLGTASSTTNKKLNSSSNSIRQRKISKNQRRDSANSKSENNNGDNNQYQQYQQHQQSDQQQQQYQQNPNQQQRRRSSAANSQYQRRRQSTKSLTINESTSNGSVTTNDNINMDTNLNNQQQPQARRIQRRSHNSFSCTGDPEKDKRIKTLYKKLSDIAKLKTKQSKGEHLEANQLTKIAGENSIIDELRALKISS